MGIAWLLLRRTFSSRPKRTLLFILGYALAIAVMITLLSVGEAVLQQAQDKNLLGGGDLILVPQGIDIESMKTGGISALYYSIPQARFVVRQLLGSSRFRGDIDTVSPYLFSKLSYARRAGTIDPPETAYAEGSLPDQERTIKAIPLPWKNNGADEKWLHPQSTDFYNEIDRFHLPAAAYPEMDRWAEWHYFNFETDDYYGYLSIMVVGNVLKDQASWTVSLQLFDNGYRRFAANYPAARSGLPLNKVEYQVGSNQIRFNKDHYEIALDFQDKASIRGTLRYYPDAGLYFPPTYLARNDQMESGYVIPAIRGTYQGTLRIGQKEYDFNNVTGYHDHNWGIWRRIEWNWGHLFSDQYAIFFGEIFLDGKGKGLFAGVFDRSGFVTVLRPDHIEFSDIKDNVPQQLRIRGQKQFAAIDLTGKASSFVSTKLEGAPPLYFIQSKMEYSVQLEIDGKRALFPARGNAETYVK